MASREIVTLPPAMMTRWRRRQLCLLERTGQPATPAVIRAVDGHGARLECIGRPAVGEAIAIRHPEAGRIEGEVVAALKEGVLMALPRDAKAVAFALAVIASDMSNPA